MRLFYRRLLKLVNDKRFDYLSLYKAIFTSQFTDNVLDILKPKPSVESLLYTLIIIIIIIIITRLMTHVKSFTK